MNNMNSLPNRSESRPSRRLAPRLEACEERMVLTGGLTQQITLDLMAGQHHDAGDIIIEQYGEDEVSITFRTENGWSLEETHVSIGDALSTIPRTRSGSPKIGNFEYKQNHDDGTTEVTYLINLNVEGLEVGELAHAAAHAVVERVNVDPITNVSSVQRETAWGEGTRFTNASWATYFTFFILDDDNGGGGDK